ncbi:hypothetical protein KY290_015255 [Solanum tuberosum]|uniref:Uncharacterized protein n=1 Tax=Solanum tuberosum TaxID=4113 RepID=A0ABQ7VS20_SOLTU|nr:hypothetical protein KY289_014866 [Solanum tuberosum]KAH0771274.1 hypothetical protein KY290_015255 [Solanum tuberosum]
MAGAHNCIAGKLNCRQEKIQEIISSPNEKWRRSKGEGHDLLLKAIRSAPFLFRAVYEPSIENHRVEIYPLAAHYTDLAHLSWTA